MLGLLHSAVAGHEGGHLLDALEGERRRAERPHGDAHELHRVVVRRHAVGAERAAAAAAVNDGPFSAPAHPDGDRLHDPAAVTFPVARLNVQMQACKAVRAVVAVAGACVFRDDSPSADLADEGVAAGVGLIVAFFKGFAFVFAIHVAPPEDVGSGSSGGMACDGICQTSRSDYTLQ